MTIIGILAAIAVPALKNSPQKGREAALREDLFTFRSCSTSTTATRAITRRTSQTLVTDGYIRKLPIDPITKSDSHVDPRKGRDARRRRRRQRRYAPDTPGIIDVHSGSKAKALDGTLYSDW